MPKRSSTDPNVTAARILAEAIGEATPKQPPEKPKNPAAVALGRLGGKAGGAARAKNLTKEQLAAIGKKGANARWAKKRQP